MYSSSKTNMRYGYTDIRSRFSPIDNYLNFNLLFIFISYKNMHHKFILIFHLKQDIQLTHFLWCIKKSALVSKSKDMNKRGLPNKIPLTSSLNP